MSKKSLYRSIYEYVMEKDEVKCEDILNYFNISCNQYYSAKNKIKINYPNDFDIFNNKIIKKQSNTIAFYNKIALYVLRSDVKLSKSKLKLIFNINDEDLNKSLIHIKRMKKKYWHLIEKKIIDL